MRVGRLVNFLSWLVLVQCVACRAQTTGLNDASQVFDRGDAGFRPDIDDQDDFDAGSSGHERADASEDARDAAVVTGTGGQYLQFCLEMIEAADRRRIECVGGTTREYASRNEQSDWRFFCAAHASAIDAGKRDFDVSAGMACLLELNEASCGDLGGAWMLQAIEYTHTLAYVSSWSRYARPSVCSSVVLGAGQEGDACDFDVDCGTGTRCHNYLLSCGGPCTHRCRAVLAAEIGEPCDCERICSSGSYCSPNCGDAGCAPRCVALREEGESCAEYVAGCRRPDLYCDEDFTCRRTAATGGECFRSYDMQYHPCRSPSDVCAGPHERMTCQPMVRVGELCDPDNSRCPSLSTCTASSSGEYRCRLLPLAREESVSHPPYEFGYCWPGSAADAPGDLCWVYQHPGLSCSSDLTCGGPDQRCIAGVCDIRPLCE